MNNSRTVASKNTAEVAKVLQDFVNKYNSIPHKNLPAKEE
jgi:hypothetical protein